MGGASSQVVFTLTDKFSTKDFLYKFKTAALPKKPSSRRLRKI
jgi:hypothetical protein